MTIPVFQQLQRQFLNHLRQPLADNPPAGFTADRLAVYQELLYNKFDESLSACFPVLHTILESGNWRTLVTDFIAEHQCLTPYYRKIPDEFVIYLQQERLRTDDLPFLAELAHFEWIELVLSLAEAEPAICQTLTDSQLLNEIPVFTPIMQLLHYSWPVQQISPLFQPTTMPAVTTHVLGFRDLEEHVQFIALNSATARLILLLQNGMTGKQALQEIGAELNPSQQIELIRFGQHILADMHRQGVIININQENLEIHREHPGFN